MEDEGREKRKYDNSMRAERAAQRRLFLALEYEREQQRKAKRREWLEKVKEREARVVVPEDYKCPSCRKVRLNRRSWRLLEDGRTVCVACSKAGPPLPENRVCPRCKRQVFGRSHWAVRERGGPVCRKCSKERKEAESMGGPPNA